MQEFPYPGMDHFLGAYLNQDWDYEYASDLEALDDFVEGDSRGPGMLSEINSLLALPERQLYDAIYPRSGYGFGDSAHAWLEKLRAHLLKRMDDRL